MINKIKVGVVGFGYWSPKLINGFKNTKKADIVAVCDKDEARWESILEAVPGVRLYKHYEEMVQNPDMDAVVITTTVSSHYRIAKAALLAGKHVLIEKPMTETFSQARELERLARKKKLTLMVDHTFMFSPAVRQLKKMIDGGAIGNVHTVIGSRMNLGLFQKDIDVVYDLAPHDFSILFFLFPEIPTRIHVESHAPIQHPHIASHLASVAHTTVHYPNKMAHFTHTWLSPVKDRRILIIGEKGAIVYDMLNQTAPVQMFGTRVEINIPEEPYGSYFNYINSEPTNIPLPEEEGDDLQRVAQHFIESVQSDGKQEPITGAEFGSAVVYMLTKASKSKTERGWLAGLLKKVTHRVQY